MSRATPHIDRRALIRAGTTAAAALAAGSTLNLGAIALTRAAGPDPIFAAIAAHQLAWDNLGRCSELDAADTPEADAELERLWLAYSNARAALVNPTTIAGAVALLRHVHDHQEDMDGIGSSPHDLWVDSVYLNIADVLEGVAS
jgi:hypothetical protein